MKTLWVVGGGAEAVPGIQRAKAMGLHVVVSDGSPHAPGFAVADECITASTYDVEATVRMARAYSYKQKIDGVIALVADVPVTVASVAAEFGLPGLPLDVARLGADKLAMKAKLRSLGILTSDGFEVTSAEHLRRITYGGPMDNPSIEWPFLVKPVDSRGARGVIRMLQDVDPTWAYVTAHSYSPTGRVMAEHWLDGPQISTETVNLPDGCRTPGFLDRNYSRLDEFEPFVVEDGADAPTRLSDQDKRQVTLATEIAVRSLVGNVPCTVKGDVALVERYETEAGGGPVKRVVIIELALRLSGGYMSSQLVPINTGVDLVGAAIKIALGEPVSLEDVTPVSDIPAAIRYDIPPGCTNHPERKRHVIAAGGDPGDAIRAAEHAVQQERATGQLIALSPYEA